MADDELSTPLGQSAKMKRRRFKFPIRVSHIVAGGLAVFLLACGVWALVVDDPLGGEPIAMVATGFDPPKRPVMPAVISGAGAVQGPRNYDGPGSPAPKQVQVPAPAQPAAAPPPNTKTVTIIDGSTGKRQEVAISAGA